MPAVNKKVSNRGEKHNQWKNGRAKTLNGYITLYMGYEEKRKLEHVHVVESHINRKLKHDEIVHHINGIRDDNRIENLQVMTRSDHTRLHQTGKKTNDKTKALFRKIRAGTNHKEVHPQWKEEITKESIIDSLIKFKKKEDAAKYLGINIDTLRARERHYGIYKNYTTKNFKKIEVEAALKNAKCLAHAAKALGVDPKTMKSKMKHFNLTLAGFKNAK